MQFSPPAVLEQFADVEPIPQDDGPNPIVSIAYSQECTCVCAARPEEWQKSGDRGHGRASRGEHADTGVTVWY